MEFAPPGFGDLKISVRGLLGGLLASIFEAGGYMHPIPFFLKRAHHSSLAKQRKWLAEFEITPARYDLLVVIADINSWMKKVHFVHQSDLWKALGVTPAVVCKMLRALEKLKLVRRQRSRGCDRRQVNVEL